MSSRRPLLALLTLAVGITVAAVPPAAAGTDPVDRARPLQGVAAVRALHADPAAATRRTAELQALLLDDPTAWLDTAGRVFFRDVPPTLIPTTTPAARGAAYPLAQTFRLHSRAGSTRTIFLDFDGGSVAGSDWAREYGLASTQPGWSTDGAAGFSADEQAIVQDVWQRVAEDYAPFDVDVTTQDPGAAAITRSSRTDTVFGTRVLITTGTAAARAICDGGCAGVAYLDAFDVAGTAHPRLQPAWVFAGSFPTFAKGIAEAAAHEAGHTLGLKHDGRTDGAEYDAGHGMWAPIMGGGGSPKAMTQWSQGSYAKANNHEDDLAVITAHGLALRADEADATVSAAATLPRGPAYITQRSDVDVYGLGRCTGELTVAGLNAPTSPDLDLRLRLLDATGAVLATASPASSTGYPAWDVTAGTDATVRLAAADGPVFVEVDGVGNGPWSTQYDDYGSLGAYTLTPSGTCTGFVGAAPAPAASTPGAPRVRASYAGRRGGRRTAGVQWAAPASDGGAAVSGYQVQARRLDARGRTTGTRTSSALDGTRRSAEMRLPIGRWRLAVRARNRVGWGPWSPVSRTVRAR